MFYNKGHKHFLCSFYSLRENITFVWESRHPGKCPCPPFPAIPLHSPPSPSTHASRPLRSINIIEHNSDARLSLLLLYSVWSDLSDISFIASSTVHVTDRRKHCLKQRRPNIPVQSPTDWLTHPFTYHNQLQFRLILLLWEELIGKCFFCHWKLFVLWIDKYKNQNFSKNAINSVLLTDIACEAKLYLSIDTGLEEDCVVQYRIFGWVP